MPESETITMSREGYYLVSLVVDQAWRHLKSDYPENLQFYLDLHYHVNKISHRYFFPFCLITGNIPDFLYHSQNHDYIYHVAAVTERSKTKDRFDKWASSNRRNVSLAAASVLGYKINDNFKFDNNSYW